MRKVLALSVLSISANTTIVGDSESFEALNLIINLDLKLEQVQKLVKTDILKIQIHLTDVKSVVYRPYRLSHNE